MVSSGWGSAWGSQSCSGMTRSMALLVALALTSGGCSFATRSRMHRTDLVIGGAALVGGALLIHSGKEAAKDCHGEDGLCFDGIGEALLGGTLALSSLPFLLSAAYGASLPEPRPAPSYPPPTWTAQDQAAYDAAVRAEIARRRLPTPR